MFDSHCFYDIFVLDSFENFIFLLIFYSIQYLMIFNVQLSLFRILILILSLLSNFIFLSISSFKSIILIFF